MSPNSAVMEPPEQTAANQITNIYQPSPPQTLEEAGLTNEMVDALVFKYLLNVGSAAGAKIASTLALPHPLVVERLTDLKKQQLLGYVGNANMGDFTYTLSEAGRERARSFMEESMYFGAAPVPLSQYCEAVKVQSITHEKPGPEQLRTAFSDLLINEKMFSTLGPAINSGRGLFLYGPPGNGKTSIAERITYCFGTEILIPYAIHVDGFIVRLFDPEIHDRVPTPKATLFKSAPVDERWVRIKRPTVIVGGELTMDQLEIRWNPTTRVSEASMQLKSNCGTLVIDDFGRQRMNPFELLNRWIVPLEKRFDFLALANGVKIQVPFDQLLIFSTNLEPKDLVDDAFLRRIPYKVRVGNPSEEEYRTLMRMMTDAVGMSYDDALVTKLIQKHYTEVGRPFRCCQPRDLVMLSKNYCEYNKIPVHLDEETLDYAVDVYFTVMEGT